MPHTLRNILFRLFRWNETRFHKLNYLFWECTTRCNLHCVHCGSDCGATSPIQDMPLDDFLKAFDTIPAKVRPRRFTVVLTGGEEGFVGMDFVGEAFACTLLAVVGEIGHSQILLELVHKI